jgi:hypothetical protein
MREQATIGLDPMCWVVGDPGQPGEWSAEDRAFIASLKELHPELSGWGDAAIGFAWGRYSEDVFLISWAYWNVDRDPAFLAYLYVKQTKPSFNFGRCGGWVEDLCKLAESQPWLEPDEQLPAWLSS